MLWKTSEGYDQTCHADSLVKMCQKLDALRKWEAGDE